MYHPLTYSLCHGPVFLKPWQFCGSELTVWVEPTKSDDVEHDRIDMEYLLGQR